MNANKRQSAGSCTLCIKFAVANHNNLLFLCFWNVQLLHGSLHQIRFGCIGMFHGTAYNYIKIRHQFKKCNNLFRIKFRLCRCHGNLITCCFQRFQTICNPWIEPILFPANCSIAFPIFLNSKGNHWFLHLIKRSK